MKNKIIIILLITIVISITGCGFLVRNDILKTIEIDEAKCKIEIQFDNHSGFLGDGDYFAKIKCTDLNYEKLSNNWKKLPLSSELNEVLEIKECGYKSCQNVYEKYSIPNITNGYYYFLDRHSDSIDRYDDKDLNNRSSWNFTLAIIDIDSNIIYYYELDT